jgi:hypothetical protein
MPLEVKATIDLSPHADFSGIAIVKEDSIAREWLTRDAARWLDGAAEWHSK